MILGCPDCDTRYFVPDESIPAEGRTVRCTACGFAWRAAAETPLDLVADEVSGATAREPGFGRRGDDAPPASLDQVAAPELPRVMRAQAEEKRRMRRAMVAGAIWAVIGAGVTGLAAAAYLFRVDVVDLYPRAAAAYALVGAPVNPVGLDFVDVQARPAEDGAAAIDVSGRLWNLRDDPRVAPPVRVTLVDAEGRRVTTRIVHLPSTPLTPGERRPFSLRIPDPHGRAADVDLAFAPDAPPPVAETLIETGHVVPSAPTLGLREATPDDAPSSVPPVEAQPLTEADVLAAETAEGLDNAGTEALSPVPDEPSAP